MSHAPTEPTALSRFLARQNRVSENKVRWSEQVELEVSGYLSAESPPRDLVSSIRAVVLRGDHVLVMRNLDSTHILPGGRVERGETFEETLRRELLEEAGVEIEVMGQIGFAHLKHMTPRPEVYPYPYPDFFWPIYVALFAGSRPEAKVEDDYEVWSGFLPLPEVRRLTLGDHEKAFLEAAVIAFS